MKNIKKYQRVCGLCGNTFETANSITKICPFCMEKNKKEYNKSQCVYGPDSTMPCGFCSAMCKERYEDFKKRKIKIKFI